VTKKRTQRKGHCAVGKEKALRRAKRTRNANLAPSDRIVCVCSFNACISSKLRSSGACAFHVFQPVSFVIPTHCMSCQFCPVSCELTTLCMSFQPRYDKGDAPARHFLSDWPIPRPVDWTSRVNRADAKKELEALRRSVQRGQQPYGTEPWFQQIVQQLGLESTLRPRGRPRNTPPEP
jgi:hypothetical protein